MSEVIYIPNTIVSTTGLVHAYDREAYGARPYAVAVCGIYLSNWGDFQLPVTCKRCLKSIAKGARQ